MGFLTLLCKGYLGKYLTKLVETFTNSSYGIVLFWTSKIWIITFCVVVNGQICADVTNNDIIIKEKCFFLVGNTILLRFLRFRTKRYIHPYIHRSFSENVWTLVLEISFAQNRSLFLSWGSIAWLPWQQHINEKYY